MYSDEIMRTIRTMLLEDPEDTSKDAEILEMPRLEVLEKCLNWENIVGYSGVIIGFINGIYHVNLEPMLEQAEQD